MSGLVYFAYGEFSKVWGFVTPATYTDETADAIDTGTDDVLATSSPPNINANPALADILYVGHTYNRFCRLYVEVSTTSTVGFTLSYSNLGGTWTAVPGIAANTTFFSAASATIGLATDTYPITTPGTMRDNWGTLAVNGVTAYWMRFHATATGSGVQPKLTRILPAITLPSPATLSDQDEYFGGNHQMADGSRSLAAIARKRRMVLGWPLLSYNDMLSVAAVWELNSAFYYYSSWSDAASGVQVLPDPDAPFQAERRNTGGGVVKFPCQIGLMEA